jgi:hypothetical protein
MPGNVSTATFASSEYVEFSNQECSGLLNLDTQLSGNLPLERSDPYEEKTHV